MSLGFANICLPIRTRYTISRTLDIHEDRKLVIELLNPGRFKQATHSIYSSFIGLWATKTYWQLKRAMWEIIPTNLGKLLDVCVLSYYGENDKAQAQGKVSCLDSGEQGLSCKWLPSFYFSHLHPKYHHLRFHFAVAPQIFTHSSQQLSHSRSSLDSDLQPPLAEKPTILYLVLCRIQDCGLSCPSVESLFENIDFNHFTNLIIKNQSRRQFLQLQQRNVLAEADTSPGPELDQQRSPISTTSNLLQRFRSPTVKTLCSIARYRSAPTNHLSGRHTSASSPNIGRWRFTTQGFIPMTVPPGKKRSPTGIPPLGTTRSKGRQNGGCSRIASLTHASR